MDFDLVINNGTVVDGSGRTRFRADVGIRAGKIAAIVTGEHLSGWQALDATGLIVAPGFIDAHSHSEWVLPDPDHERILAPLVLQGITTMVAGMCGFSPAPLTDDSVPLVDKHSGMLRERAFPYRWRSMGEFLDALDQDGLLLNTAMLVGHGIMRLAVMGERPDRPTSEELQLLCHLTGQALQQGAYGLSAGLGYVPGMFAEGDELLALLRIVAEQDAIYAVHNRTYRCVSPFYEPLTGGLAHNVRSVREQLDLAQKSGARLQLSHLIFVGRNTWQTHRTVLHDIEQAVEGGAEVAFDAFPYTFGNTTINVNFPKWFVERLDENIGDPAALRLLREEFDLHFGLVGRGYDDIYLLSADTAEYAQLEGLDFASIAHALSTSPFEAYVAIARASSGRARILQDTFSGDAESEEPLQAILAHPLCAFMLDTILTRKGKPNPASVGAFPRLLGRYSRDLQLFSLEEAVRRMTSYSADRIGLQDVGRVAKGLWADLVLFDAEKVADNTTPGRPDVPPSGIRTVLISGQIAAQSGELVSGTRLGRVLRR